MATQNLWGISTTQRNVRPGWTAASIAHNEALHKSAQSSLAPTPQQSAALSAITNKILGVNMKAGTSAPAGAPVGMAYNQGGSIPDVISQAIGNLQTNINTNAMGDVLQKFLAAVGSKPPTVVNTTSPEMEQYYKNKNIIMAEPSNIQTNINRLSVEADKLQPKGVMSITPGIPGAYEGSVTQNIDKQLMQSYLAQNQAKQAAHTTGWLPYMPMY